MFGLTTPRGAAGALPLGGAFPVGCVLLFGGVLPSAGALPIVGALPGVVPFGGLPGAEPERGVVRPSEPGAFCRTDVDVGGRPPGVDPRGGWGPVPGLVPLEADGAPRWDNGD